MITIVPAFIPESKDSLMKSLQQFYGVPEIHIDMVDGIFIPHSAWPYNPKGEIIDLKSSTDHFTLEVDLMVADPRVAAEEWSKVGADMLVFHTENFSVAEFKDFVTFAPRSVSISIAATSDTPLDSVYPYLEFADGVQLMGIASIGAQGQPFDSRVLERISTLRQRFPKLPITVDGSVNQETIPQLKRAGVNRLVCGSAITRSQNPLQTYKELLAAAN